jgi:hypothetical protein
MRASARRLATPTQVRAVGVVGRELSGDEQQITVARPG